jgi:diguanylate cyclase (GGDEF)-like protein
MTAVPEPVDATPAELDLVPPRSAIGVARAPTDDGDADDGDITPRPRSSGRILVVDDDRDITRFIQLNLGLEGFEVTVSHNASEAMEQVAARLPDLVLLDVMMPSVDGVELCRRLRSDPMTAVLPLIMLTAKGRAADKVIGLDAGADDYVVKPFDTLELVARIRAALRRNREVRSASPLTGLPGNTRILAEIASRSAAEEPFAVCHVDLDNFKSVNDAYGFVRGDEVIHTLAKVLYQAAQETGPPVGFLGHIGGDDFVLVCEPDQVEALTKRALTLFEAEVPRFYDADHLARGYLEMPDRRGNVQQYGLVTVSVGVSFGDRHPRGDPAAVVAAASEMKHVAKSRRGSVVAVDRRRAAESTSRGRHSADTTGGVSPNGAKPTVAT